MANQIELRQNPCDVCRRHLSARFFAAAIAAFGAGHAFSVPMSANAEDIAICAAVNRYPQLRPGANLSGCVNDAHLMARKLQQLGFHDPIVMTNAMATKAGLFGKIAAVRGRLHAGDRFVFYFAGHGTRSSSGESVILPSDARDTGGPNDEANDIQVKELYDAVKGLGDGVQKTIVLDSCHSGGMVRGIQGLRGHNKLRPRLYVRGRDLNRAAPGHRDVKRWQETDSSGGDNLATVVRDDHASAGGGICYFTAAEKNEVANETTVNGEEHGLFTYYLVGALREAGDIWKDVSAQVSDKVATDTESEQKPLLYPSNMLDRVVFGGSAAPKPQPLGLDAIYNLSNPDPDAVSLRRFVLGDVNATGPVAIGSKNYFEITAGREGYLVVIGRDPTGALDILYPKTPTAEGMQVHAGLIVRIPGTVDHFLVPDTAGSDGVKAILFGSPENALAMLKPFSNGTDSGYKSLPVKAATRAWREVGNDAAGDTHFYTSEITTQIIPPDGGNGGR